jgi:FkbM family methyltransferase
MLIPLSHLVKKYDCKITGIVHIGAHECEELGCYLNEGVSFDKIYWFEAIDDLVEKCRRQIPNVKIYHTALSDKDGVECEFIVTNNFMSSSLLELKEHLIEHPSVHEIRRDKVVTSTFATFVNRNNIDLTGVNFINLDIQGMELPVIKGMGKLLEQIEYIYTEVNVKELYANGTLLCDLNSYLAEHGFARVDTSLTQHGWGDAFYIKVRK